MPRRQSSDEDEKEPRANHDPVEPTDPHGDGFDASAAFWSHDFGRSRRNDTFVSHIHKDAIDEAQRLQAERRRHRPNASNSGQTQGQYPSVSDPYMEELRALAGSLNQTIPSDSLHQYGRAHPRPRQVSTPAAPPSVQPGLGHFTSEYGPRIAPPQAQDPFRDAQHASRPNVYSHHPDPNQSATSGLALVSAQPAGLHQPTIDRLQAAASRLGQEAVFLTILNGVRASMAGSDQHVGETDVSRTMPPPAHTAGTERASYPSLAARPDTPSEEVAAVEDDQPGILQPFPEHENQEPGPSFGDDIEHAGTAQASSEDIAALWAPAIEDDSEPEANGAGAIQTSGGTFENETADPDATAPGSPSSPPSVTNDASDVALESSHSPAREDSSAPLHVAPPAAIGNRHNQTITNSGWGTAPSSVREAPNPTLPNRTYDMRSTGNQSQQDNWNVNPNAKSSDWPAN